MVEIEQIKSRVSLSSQIGVLSPEGRAKESNGIVVFKWGRWGKWDELAQKLFEGLRWLERQKVVAIIAPLPPPVGLGLAIRDRLTKASSSDDEILDK